MMAFLLGCLCGFVGAVLLIFIYVSIRVGGDKHE